MMKKILSLMILCFSSQAFAAVQDGCYRLGVSSGMICIQGAQEEGLNGGSATVAFLIFDKVKWCGVTHSISATEGNETYDFDSRQFGEAGGSKTRVSKMVFESNTVSILEYGSITGMPRSIPSLDLTQLTVGPDELSQYTNSTICRSAKQ